MKIFISHSTKFNYEKELYQPIRNSVLNHQHEFFLPHENGLSINTKQIIQSSDLILAEVSYPSVGSSIEIGWGDAFGLPLVCVYQKNTEPSSALRFLTGDFIEYASPEDLLNQLEIYLKGFTSSSRMPRPLAAGMNGQRNCNGGAVSSASKNTLVPPA